MNTLETHRSIKVAQKLLDEAINRPGMRTNGPLYVQVPADILNTMLIYVHWLEVIAGVENEVSD